MALISTALILQKLYDHLGDERDDLGEVLADAAYGADILNPDTKELVKMLFSSIEDNVAGDLEFADLVNGIRHVGTPFAVATAQDMSDAEPADLD